MSGVSSEGPQCSEWRRTWQSSGWHAKIGSLGVAEAGAEAGSLRSATQCAQYVVHGTHCVLCTMYNVLHSALVAHGMSECIEVPQTKVP